MYLRPQQLSEITLISVGIGESIDIPNSIVERFLWWRELGKV
jgi:hypothetical protein